MIGEFVIKDKEELKTYFNYNDIPESFDHLISFKPETPLPPHTEEQHKEMETWNQKLQDLIKREKR